MEQAQNVISIWEIIMVVCFGCSWPFSILKTIRVKNPTGKSYLFMSLIIIGYIAGCIHKILHRQAPGFWVFWLYLLNTLLVASDFLLCLYYQRQLNRNKNQ